MAFFYARLFTPHQTEGLLDEPAVDHLMSCLYPGRGIQTGDEYLLLRVLIRDFLDAASSALESAGDAADQLRRRIRSIRAVVMAIKLMNSLLVTQHRNIWTITRVSWRRDWDEITAGKPFPSYLKWP